MGVNRFADLVTNSYGLADIDHKFSGFSDFMFKTNGGLLRIKQRMLHCHCFKVWIAYLKKVKIADSNPSNLHSCIVHL